MTQISQFENFCSYCGCELETRVEGFEYDLLYCAECLAYTHRPRPRLLVAGHPQVEKAGRLGEAECELLRSLEGL